MNEAPCLRRVTTDELVETIAFALHYDGRGRLAAERVVAHLEQCRFVVMKKPALSALPDNKPESHTNILKLPALLDHASIR